MKKIVYLTLLCLLALTFSCKSGNTASVIERPHCDCIVIEGPITLLPGEVVVFKAIAYDEQNVRISNTEYVFPVWTIADTDIVVIDKNMGHCIRIKALKTGTTKLSAKQDEAVTETFITVSQ